MAKMAMAMTAMVMEMAMTIGAMVKIPAESESGCSFLPTRPTGMMMKGKS